MPRPIRVKSSTKKTNDSVIDRIRSIGFDDNDGIKLALYGKSGTGKTTLWSTFPKPILAIICSGGNKSGELRSIDTVENRKSIKQVELNDSSEIFDLCNFQKEEEKFRTIVLDHSTGLQDLVLKEIIGLDEIPVQKTWGLATQQQWGQIGIQTKELLRQLLSLDCNVVIIGQEREFNTEQEDSELKPYVGFGLTPSISNWVNFSVDYLCQTFLKQKEEVVKVKTGNSIIEKTKKLNEIEYCLRVSPNPTYMTKFRVPKPDKKLPEYIIDPTFQKIIDIINKQK